MYALHLTYPPTPRNGDAGQTSDSDAGGRPTPDPDALADALADAALDAEAEMVLSAMDAGRAGSTSLAAPDLPMRIGPAADVVPAPDRRRRGARTGHRVRAGLRLFADAPGVAPWALFTRDVDRRGVGFIARERVPLGHGGRVEFVAPDGRIIEASCTVLRCRPTVNGWCEGALYFNRHQGRLG